MTELTENRVHHDTVCPEESMMAALKDKSSPAEVFNNALEISQDVALTEREDSEEADSRDKPEHENRQHDGPSSAGDPTDAESKWEVGDQCRAVWSEDGKEYPATVVSVDGKHCRVCFTGYGNEEDVELSALKSPTAAPQMENSPTQDWKPGSRCRAVYSEDGRVYPAVVLWVNGQRCRVRFDHYNNEEEQDVNCLLNPDELYGPSRATVKVSNWKSSATSRQRRENNQGERGAERRPAGHDDQNYSRAKERPGSQSSMGKDTDEMKGRQQTAGAEKPANHSFPLFPPFPPPSHLGSAHPLAFLPPPPPIWMFGGEKSDGSPGTETMSSMLMLWYMCGFHTGSFMAQMFKSTSKD